MSIGIPMVNSEQDLLLVTARTPPTKDGVGDYTYRLGKELSKSHSVSILTTMGQRAEADSGSFRVLPVIPRWDVLGMRQIWQTLERLRPSFINLQWVPFLWGRLGINLAVPLTAIRLRRAGHRVVTTIHEPYVAWGGVRRFPLALLQRAQLSTLITGSSKITVTIWAWVKELQRAYPKRAGDIVWIPVGSNIPVPTDLSTGRRQARQALGSGDGELAIGAFSPLGSGKQLDFIAAAWEQVKGQIPEAKIVVIGANADEVRTLFPKAPRGGRVRHTGYLPPEDVSQHLLALDVMLAPFVDGISCRRTSAIAAMAHGLPLVTTRGHLTDPIFDGSPMVLVPAHDREGFAQAATDLAMDCERQDELSRRTRAFFDQHFAWKIIAERLIASTDVLKYSAAGRSPAAEAGAALPRESGRRERL